MRVLFLGNNRVGWQVLSRLQERTEVVGAVLHPPERRAYGKELIECATQGGYPTFDGSRLREPEVLEAVKETRPDIGVSAFFTYILRAEFLEMFPRGCINLHPAFLPYNRGSYPNVWSIVERTPAGATIHYIDEGVDTGDIVARRQVDVEPVDTGETLYRKLEDAAVALFEETWPLIISNREPRLSQTEDEGTYHRYRDVDAIDQIDLDAEYTARYLIDVIRARTFPPHPGAYFVEGGRKIYLRLGLSYGEDLEEES